MVNVITSTENLSNTLDTKSFRLIDFIGKRLRLIEKPDGNTTAIYPVRTGEYYQITGTGGCVFEVAIPEYGTGLLHYERFDLQNPK